MPSSDYDTLRAIARRAGVRSALRLHALEIIVRAGAGSEALRVMTARWPAYEEVYTAFEAEVTRVRGIV